MEFRSEAFVIVGILGFVFWLMGNFNVFKKAEIYYPNHKNKSFPWSKIIQFILGALAWALISFSLMGPREPTGNIQEKSEVNDIFLVVDVSRSMLATDFAPNRLEVAKKKIAEFIKLRPTDRVGIIIFGSNVFTLLPLTRDMELIKKMVKNIKVGFLGGGTNMGDAIGLAIARASQSLTENKVVILLTDGVANVGSIEPLQAAEEAAKKNLKIYTIGIGGKHNNKVLKLNPGGQYQKIPGGSVDLETLEKISQITRGKSFFAKDSSALERIFFEIQQLEKTEIEASSIVVYQENYIFYLAWGIFLLMLSEILKRTLFREGW